MPMTASVTVHVDKDGAMAITQNEEYASGVFRNRHHALETMKKILKEKQ